MMIFACLVCVCGCISLSLLKKRHRKDVFSQNYVWSATLLRARKTIGLLCLVGSFSVFISVKGLARGLVYGFAWLTLIALSLSFFLSLRSH